MTVFDSNGNELDDSALGNRYCFQGREIDYTTGLYNFRARWYDPETGRWLSKDPIGINGGLNQYVFCGNNPVMFGDPEGKSILGGLIVVGLVGWGIWGAYKHFTEKAEEMDEAGLSPELAKPMMEAGLSVPAYVVGTKLPFSESLTTELTDKLANKATDHITNKTDSKENDYMDDIYEIQPINPNDYPDATGGLPEEIPVVVTPINPNDYK